MEGSEIEGQALNGNLGTWTPFLSFCLLAATM